MGTDELRRFLTRRTAGKVFLGSATCGYACAIGYPVLRYLASGAETADEGAQVNEIALGKPDDVFGPPGTPAGKNFAFGSKPALVVRLGASGEVVAFDATCTHLGCTVAYQPKTGKIVCPCHGGAYDPATGKNVGGPPPGPLRRLDAAIEGDKLVIRRPGASKGKPGA